MPRDVPPHLPRRIVLRRRARSPELPLIGLQTSTHLIISAASAERCESRRVAPNAAVQRPHAALSSAQQAHNEVARLLRASDWVSRSAATACSATHPRPNSPAYVASSLVHSRNRANHSFRLTHDSPLA